MPATLDLPLLAHRVKAAQDRCHALDPITSQHADFDLPAAYELAHLIHQQRLEEGAVPVGRKLGFTNADMWPLYGVHEPVWGYVYDRSVVHLPPGPAVCSLGRFMDPKIEPEIVVHFRSAPPVGAGLAEILDAIDWVAHAFEVVQSHYPAWKFRAPDAVANLAMHATLLVGPPQPVQALGSDLIARLESFSVALSCGAEVREVATGAKVLGSPLAAVAHLIAVLAKQPQYVPLQAQELLTTGTITTAHSIRPGETWRTRLEGIGLPDLCVEFVE